MNYNIVTERAFLREVKRLSKKYKSLKQALQRLQDELLANPQAGADLGNGVHKARLAIGSKNRGKSHGACVITYTYRIDEENGNITLLYLYDKEERDSISATEINQLVAEAKASAGL